VQYNELQRTITDSEHLPPAVKKMTEQSTVSQQSFENIQHQINMLVSKIEDTHNLQTSEREKAKSREESLQKIHEIFEKKVQELSEANNENKAIIEELARTSNPELTSEVNKMKTIVEMCVDIFLKRAEKLNGIRFNPTYVLEEEQASKSSLGVGRFVICDSALYRYFVIRQYRYKRRTLQFTLYSCQC
jgi:hypothetical protein